MSSNRPLLHSIPDEIQLVILSYLPPLQRIQILQFRYPNLEVDLDIFRRSLKLNERGIVQGKLKTLSNSIEHCFKNLSQRILDIEFVSQEHKLYLVHEYIYVI